MSLHILIHYDTHRLYRRVPAVPSMLSLANEDTLDMETARDLKRQTKAIPHQRVPVAVINNPAAQQAIHAGSLRRTLTRVAWLGIGLGVLMELLLVIIQFGAVQ